VIIADDSVQDKRYSKFIELVKNSIAAMNTAQYIRLTWSILSIRRATMETDYRIYHTESDGLTKNDSKILAGIFLLVGLVHNRLFVLAIKNATFAFHF
jgi:hypothetical protein